MCLGASFSSILAPKVLISTTVETSVAQAQTSSNSIVSVWKSMPMPPLASLTPPEIRPNSLSSMRISRIFSFGTRPLSRYSFLNSGSILSYR